MEPTLIDRWRRLPQLAAFVAVLLVVLGVVAVGRAEQDYRSHEQSEARIEAQIVAINVAAAVDFGDHAAAQEAADALHVNAQVRRVGVYDQAGKLFAGYSRDGGAAPGGDMVVERVPVMRSGARLGTVVVVSDLEHLSRRMLHYGVIALLVILASLVVAILGIAQSALRTANRELVEANDALRGQIAQRERAESQLRQAQKMESLGQLTGGIAHDFNNMLAIVIGNLDMVTRRLRSDPDKALRGIEHALEGATRAAALTRRLLAFSRRQPLEPQPLDANKLVSGMSELLRRTLGEQVRIETVLAGGLWRTSADPGQLENAILNLSVNARDAMAEGGRLTIETLNAALDEDYARDHDEVSAGQYVVIAVTDTGAGMPAEVRERAFDPFFTTKDVGKGTGLGLSQVYGFVRQSGGHVKIYSETGEGTTVKIYLPRHFGPEAARARNGATDESEMPRALNGDTILVVEDEEQVRRMSVDALRDLGYTVLEAASGAEALRHLEQDVAVDLLFTDVVMPDMNGRQLVDAVHARWPGMRVLYTTGYTRNAIVHNGMLDHDVDLLAKPFTVPQLARKIRAVLDEPGPDGG
jgi:signal transduction histidine kinase/ActR/RegA family two-component response regulator